MKKTCENCGFLFDNRVDHQCDPLVLEDRIRQEKEWRRDELYKLEADEMFLRDF